MLNKTGITTIDASTPVQILFNVQNQMAVSVKVASAAGTVEGNRTIVKAGTPLAGDLTNRTVAFTAPVAAGEGTTAKPAVGVLLHDVDVTDGPGNGSLLIFGFVNLDRIDTTTATKLTAAKAALDGKVWLLKDN